MRMLQEHSSTFYLLSLVALSSVLLAVCLKSCQIFVVLSRFTGKRLGPSSAGLEITGSSFLPASTINKLALVNVLSLFFAWGLITWTIFDRFARSELVQLENVHVTSKTDDSHFKMSIAEKPGSSRLVEFSATTCDPLEKDVVAGATLCKFYYVVDSHLHCYDWNAKHAGYTLWRDINNDPIITSDSGPPTASCTDQTTHTTSQTAEARAR